MIEFTKMEIFFLEFFFLGKTVYYVHFGFKSQNCYPISVLMVDFVNDNFVYNYVDDNGKVLGSSLTNISHLKHWYRSDKKQQN